MADLLEWLDNDPYNVEIVDYHREEVYHDR
jgi:hypothetical protein